MIRDLISKLSLFPRSTAVGVLVFALPVAAEEAIDFNRDIRPILSENCFKCHGPDENKRKGGSRKTGRLRLDTEQGSRMDLGGYTAVVPGNPEESELFYLITTEDEDDRMPQLEEGKRLNESEIALLKQWIEEGGIYDGHWAYQKPVRPSVPEIEAKGFTLVNPIDHFAAQRLVSENLAQSPEADRNALARRAALDLTGLPPTPEEVEAFLADNKSGAFERYVQNLLDKPAYGEHWARMWLDLARYADSAGYADDPLRTIWGFRDYVIRSFNENKPFDQFTIEQIAGDLLENPSIDQLVATAFHRNTKTNSEGGTNDEEFRNEAVVDRVNTTMAVWMGTTIDCAQCHTHKYDPITQEEYFKMFAIFNNSSDEDRKDEKPLIPLYTDAQNKEKAKLETEFATLENDLKKKLRESAHQQRRWKWEEELMEGDGWRVLRPSPADMTADSKAPFTIDDQGVILVGDNSAPRDNYTINTEVPAGAGTITGIRLEVQAHDQLWVLNEFEVRLIGTEQEEEEPADAEEEGDSKKKIPHLKLTNPSASFEQEWYVAKDVLDGNTGDRFTGWAVNGNLHAPNETVFELEKPLDVPEGAKLQFKLYHNFPNRKIKRFRISVSNLAKPMPAIPKELIPVLGKKVTQRTPREEDTLLNFFAQYDPGSKTELTRITEIKKKLDEIEPLTMVPVMQEVSKNRLRTTHIQYRGSFLDLGPEVSPGTPSVFQPLPKDSKPNRLGLAHWLIDHNNPLTARVVANRYWEAIFGMGIVPTSEDFGSQGEAPSHPELLDWLAVELMESGWDLKHLLKLMVSSAAYRQSSKVTPELYGRDPDNQLLARGPRFRISAEMVRDQALAVSGLLSTTMFGPPVKPPQPELGLKAAFGGETDWKTSDGEDKYRRGIYTSWRRTNPYPSMVAFDAPNREFCTIRRDRTNTPLQALVTLNDPVYIEASQALGRRMEAFEGAFEDKAAFGFQLCLTRAPSDKEVAALAKLFQAIQSRYA
ncbi:MAG: PSD1 and planctomycete cytochrome C domain-containing protein, partial [Verrucomicrobia bacterium]|nr:PSD1 and planctomycete cytochrome C domain-containing protein [Verrucomicrobiota bacterium]